MAGCVLPASATPQPPEHSRFTNPNSLTQPGAKNGGSHLGTESNHLSNGLPLRADIHTLFDLHFIGIDPTNMRVRLKPALLDGCYSEYENVWSSPALGTDGSHVCCEMKAGRSMRNAFINFGDRRA
ncbi:MAG: HNH endonuclease [Rubripirellula sp.]